MKKILTLIVAICALCAAMAQNSNPMVTLSHNGELTFFTNVGAFESAVEAAQNGDILYLSEGKFLLGGGEIMLTKRLSIVGNGYGSHLVGQIRINLSEEAFMDAPLFDGVRLDYLEFYSPSEYLGESEIRRCRIGKLIDGAEAGTDVVYDKCIIENPRFTGNGKKILVKNSKIIGTGNPNTDYLYKITAINCNILNTDYYPNASISCIIGSEPSSANGNASIFNSLLNFSPSSSYVKIDECYIQEGTVLDENADCSIDLSQNKYFGDDGTVVGIYGGEFPFSENPSVPSVDTDKSSVEYDANTNKLKVTISVKAD